MWVNGYVDKCGVEQRSIHFTVGHKRSDVLVQENGVVYLAHMHTH